MNKQRRAFAKLYPADALILGTPNVWDATLQKARLKVFINGWKACEATLASSKDAERYRWMRNNDMTAEYSEYITNALNDIEQPHFDEAIDQAMKESK